ncbi:hypothetical protein SAMN05421548_101536 [Paraburkholderia lycopersici]|uniref:Uncharacterized protein n=1 Tax=Paraburkholderia lycopersici TaxID=416944 RepID=A0A1G6H0A6_9BURK|nr:hypothetical protein SAMN05421548_101536 [Paraburkholderia lycopersici]
MRPHTNGWPPRARAARPRRRRAHARRRSCSGKRTGERSHAPERRDGQARIGAGRRMVPSRSRAAVCKTPGASRGTLPRALAISRTFPNLRNNLAAALMQINLCNSQTRGSSKKRSPGSPTTLLIPGSTQAASSRSIATGAHRLPVCAQWRVGTREPADGASLREWCCRKPAAPPARCHRRVRRLARSRHFHGLVEAPRCRRIRQARLGIARRESASGLETGAARQPAISDARLQRQASFRQRKPMPAKAPGAQIAG